jgi:hypothetical protein
MKELSYPAWFTGPKGETGIFESPDDVPNGWTSGAEKQSAKGGAPKPAAKAPEKTPAEPKSDADVDAAGTAFDPSLHAATKSKTKAGLWRMKVGVARPAPLDL